MQLLRFPSTRKRDSLTKMFERNINRCIMVTRESWNFEIGRLERPCSCQWRSTMHILPSFVIGCPFTNQVCMYLLLLSTSMPFPFVSMKVADDKDVCNKFHVHIQWIRWFLPNESGRAGKKMEMKRKYENIQKYINFESNRNDGWLQTDLKNDRQVPWKSNSSADTWSAVNPMIGIDSDRHQFHFPCWIIKK